MAGWGSGLFFLTVCAASLFGARAEFKFTIFVGKLFTYELMRETFQSDLDPQGKLYAGSLYDDPIIFKCKQQNFPDLPEWLRFIQRHPNDNGFLYGTPTAPGKSIIEVYAVNKRSYNTAKQTLVIKIVEAKMLPYQAEFFIALREIERVLPPSVQNEIKLDLQNLWNSESLEIVNMTNALDRGGRVPLPIAGHYEGVYVKVGSHKYFSECLLRVLKPEHQRQCAAEPRAKRPGGCNFCSIPSNCITWCKTKLFDLTKLEPEPPAPTMGSGVLEAGGDFSPPDSPPSTDYFPDYMVTVIVPLILAIVLCLLLAYIMFGRREGVEKRNARTDQIQLYHHYTIHGNADELRGMAGSRDGPPPLSTLPMFNSRTGDRASPLHSDDIPLIMAEQDPYSDTLPR
ncbi:Epsilon-sarcoglycan [Oryzias melastigma]|uniref:Epsilon-sarcoglycan n=1 Tax=Oryzias melastigma TaxID=30732 RepID=A0A3B3D792_ORYME|nr:alpha-sarcoglycan [Oryzias melastigma]KAF6730024.1 Epsilon-sarcoglycan [Oryzias melastigma]